MISLTEYHDDDPGTTVYINPAEVACVRAWKYHSFRESIAEIILQSGEKIRVWQDCETVMKRMKEDVA